MPSGYHQEVPTHIPQGRGTAFGRTHPLNYGVLSTVGGPGDRDGQDQVPTSEQLQSKRGKGTEIYTCRKV